MSEEKNIPEYNFKKIEKKWKDKWENDKIYQPDLDKAKKPFYNLMMFPYPSAEGLHIGGVYTFTGVDTFGRFKKMQGYDVFEPIGLDGFGIHSENYAMKIGEHIKEVSKRTEKNFYRQLSSIGNMYDWNRTVETYKPEYYKWTQWLFLQLFKKGLAYQKKAKVNWCPWCKTVLSDEQVIQGLCERCDSQVEKKELKQWFFKITDYADRLLKNLEWIDWSEDVKTNQKNWIGKSEGANIKFQILCKHQISNNKNPASASLWRGEQTNSKSQISNVVIVHGANEDKKSAFEGGRENSRHWFPWLRKELAKNKITFSNELYPEDWSPDYKEWKKIFEKNKINENTILVGHSLGCGFITRWLSENKVKVSKVILVAPYLLKEENRPGLKNMVNFDLGDIKKYCNDLTVFYSIDDAKPIIESVYCLKEKTAGNFVKFEQAGHFTKSCGFEEFPELLDEILQTNSTIQATGQIEVFTTRPDTLFGATYMVLAPEHQLIEQIKNQVDNWEEVKKYIDQAKAKSEQERKEDEKDKTGVEIKGIKAINPVNNEEIPIWIADYVLAGYGTGAIMAVPAHDERDFEFAKKYNISIKQVVTLASKEDYNNTKNTLEKLGLILNEAKKSDLKIWLLGGLAFVFHCGFIYRKHDDIDLAVKNSNDFEKATKILEKVGFEKIKEKKLEKEYAYVFKNKEGLEVELYLKLPGLSEDDFREEFLTIEGVKSRILSKEFLENIKKNQLQNRNKTKDKMDYDFLNNKSFTAEGISINSDFLDGLKTKEAKKKMIKWLEKTPLNPPLKNGETVGKKSIDYKLRDWCVSRQRYWGPPIPIIHCEKCGTVPVPEKDLPVELPDMEDFLPEGKGKGPLAKNKDFVKTICPKCGGEAERETDVSDPFVDSAWYFLRYPSTEFENEAINQERSKKWLPVDSYIGGKEHTVLHLLYSRFITMVLKDLNYIDFEEPYKKFFGHGLITKDGAKMSKSKGNVINPDEMLEKYGADTVRLYLRFLGYFSQGGDWRDNGAEGMARFVNKLWQTFFELKGEGLGVEKTQMINKTIKAIGEDLEKLSFNTAVARYMEFVNWIRENSADFNQEQASKIKATLALLIAPMAPHIAEEFWKSLGNEKSIFTEKWPEYNEDNLEDDTFELVIQINGKLRDKIKVSRGISEDEAKKISQETEKIKKHLADQTPKKIIYIKEKLINIVI